MSTTHLNQPDNTEDFSTLLDLSIGSSQSFDNKVVTGEIIAIQNDIAVIDVGLKSEGRVSVKEIIGHDTGKELRVGDKIPVFIERLENKHGEVVLSVEKARREAMWLDLEKRLESQESVEGSIFGKVKGGFAVDLKGAVAFLPASQVDVRPIRDISPLMNIIQPFKILKMDKLRNNIVVSRRSILEESRAEERSDLIAKLYEGQVLPGVVKNITDYGAFVDLGGVDGLLHVTDISWKRINHPSDALQVGQNVQVQVIRFNKDTQRISLGMKQLEEDPWKGLSDHFTPGSRHHGIISNITDYGAFVQLKNDIEGLVHVSEMSWVKKNVHPSKIVSLGDEVEVVVLEIDLEKRRLSLGLKQCQENPWENFAKENPVGSILKGTIKNITEFGLFVGVHHNLDGMVHLSDLSWDEGGENSIKNYKVGEELTVKVLAVDPAKERISLGVKQLSADPFESVLGTLKKGDAVTCSVAGISDKGIDVLLASGLKCFVKRSDLSRDRLEQRPERFAIGEKVDAKIISVDKADRKVNLSIRAREIQEEQEALSQYGSTDSGASLGDILGRAMEDKKQGEDS